MPKLLRSLGSATAWIIEPKISGLISDQSNSPESIKICRAFLENFGHSISSRNKPPFTYGKSFKYKGNSPSSVSGVFSLLKSNDRNSATSEPSALVLLAKASVKILFTAKMPVSSAKKQNSKRDKKIFN